MNMKRLFLTIIAVACTLSVMAGGRIVNGSIKSKILGTEKLYTIYLPEGYDSSEKSYPVLYLLHGAGGHQESWIQKGDVQRIADETLMAGGVRDMIIVMPDARGSEQYTGPNMGYFNVKGWAYEDYFFQEFIPHIDTAYRTIASKEGRAVAGLSMGGGGATVYAQHHPELFQASYSTSGLLDFYYYLVQLHNPRYVSSWLLSVADTSPVKYLHHATPEQLEQLRTVRWMLDCGDDDPILETNINYFVQMKHAKVPVEFRIRNGKHNWTFWKESLPQILRFCFPEQN